MTDQRRGTTAALWPIEVVSFQKWAEAMEEAQEPAGAPADLLARSEGPPGAAARAAVLIDGTVTHYGVSYNGESLGCRTGLYDSANPSIIAVGPARAREWACGTTLRVCGSEGCLVGQRQDGCPACGATHLDLSEAGIAIVCGEGAARCHVTIEARPEVP